MHTTVETVRKEDVENTIRLILETIKGLKKDQDFRYLK
jgi:putative aminopeptidase FrvX